MLKWTKTYIVKCQCQDTPFAQNCLISNHTSLSSPRPHPQGREKIFTAEAYCCCVMSFTPFQFFEFIYDLYLYIISYHKNSNERKGSDMPRIKAGHFEVQIVAIVEIWECAVFI